MGRGAILGIVAALLAVGAAVALGARTDARIHRLHVPPPPVAGGSGDISQPGTPDPSDPSVPPPAPSPPPPGSPPPPPGTPPPTAAFKCTPTGGGTTAELTGMLRDTPRSLLLSPAIIATAAALRIRGVNTGNVAHTIGIRLPGTASAALCVTPNIAPGAADTLIVENLQAGAYVVFCSIHPTTMMQNLTVS